MKRFKHIVRHEWIREGHEWPEGVPRDLGCESGTPKLYRTLVHIAERPQGTDLDIWWTESSPVEDE